MEKQKLIIASYRLPLKIKDNALVTSDGGLVSAINDSGVTRQTTWVGCLGSGGAKLESQLERMKDGREYLNINISGQSHEHYYSGFCNQVLWPGFHERTDLIEFKEKYWQAYEKSNNRFAECILMNTEKETPVWVHDYQLMLVPEILKSYQNQRQVGFFLHIPWPELKTAKRIPKLGLLAKSLQHCDLVAFHKKSYADNFKDFLLYHSRKQEVESVEAFFEKAVRWIPIGINAERFKAPKKAAQIFEEKTSQQHESAIKTIIGVDRLDYSKGIDFKINVIDELLEVRPDLMGEVKLKQLLIPSRENIPAYKNYRQKVLHLAEKVNNKYQREGWKPIDLIIGRLEQEELMKFYRSGDICLITSPRDGMNLVAMEFLASQSRKDPGVLVLSEQAGVAEFLSDALKFSHGSIEKAVACLGKAIAMKHEEACEKLSRSAKWIEEHSAKKWAMANLKMLGLKSEDFIEKDDLLPAAAS